MVVKSAVAGTVVVSAERERVLLKNVFHGLGATAEETGVMADVLLEADLRGVNSHGILRLPVIVDRVRAGLAQPGIEPELVWARSGLAHMDACHGLGHAMASRAMCCAVERSRRTGIAAVAVRNNNHIGMLGYFVEKAARDGVVALAFTTSEALVRPHGGADRLIGTNPIAVGVPSEPEPFVLDMSTAATAMGRVIDRHQRGQPIPPDWAIDRNGVPTTDAGAALEGALNPLGGPKGYGLGLAIELLAGAMVGAAMGEEVRGTLDVVHPATKGDLFIAIDPSPLPSGPDLARRAGLYLDLIRESRPGHESEAVRVPGDRARDCRRERLAEGIPLSLTAWEAALTLEEEIGSGIGGNS